MDAARRDLAERRREMLLLRQKRKVEARQAREVGAKLCGAGVRWVRVPAWLVRQDLCEKMDASAIDERFDWPKIAGASILHFGEQGEAGLLLQATLARYAEPDSRVVLVFHTHESALRLTAKDLALHLPLFLEDVIEFWIVSADPKQDWLIDYNRFDDEVCHAARLI